MGLTRLDLSDAKKIHASGKTLTLSQPDGWAESLVGLKSATGKIVDAQTALRASAVLACIRILMEDVSALPLVLKKTTPTGPADAPEHPLYRILKTAPNAFQHRFDAGKHCYEILSGQPVKIVQTILLLSIKEVRQNAHGNQ